MTKRLSIGEYLIEQLYRHGVKHVFGVPGDYVLGFYALMEKGPLKVIGTTREDAAGFAADAYARVKGMGALCVTYCVGGLNATNPVAGAWAEKSPVVVISGAPGLKERVHNPLLHHKVRDFSTQFDIFSHLTVAAARLEDPLTAYDEIDRVLHAVERWKRPGYIEIPRDRVSVTHAHEHRDRSLEEMTDAGALAECMAEVTAMVNRAKRPVILADVELHRFGLQNALVKLVERSRIPVAATILGKSVIGESHPLYVGVYEGAMSGARVRRAVESADCLLMLGCLMTDMNLGIYTANLDPRRTVAASSEKITVSRHVFEEVPFRIFIEALVNADLRRRAAPRIPKRPAATAPQAKDSERITMRTLFPIINRFLADDTVVISDVGDCLFGALDLRMHRRTEFLSPAYYTSMGFGVPAAVGVQSANRRLRPLVLVGDGAFQMTGLELSTIARLAMDPVVVVLNNHGYSTERQILDGPFNDILNWRFARLPELLGAGRGYFVRTVGEVRAALTSAMADRTGFSLIEVDLDPYDISPALKRLGESLGKRINGAGE